jgi:hypothetical protein
MRILRAKIKHENQSIKRPYSTSRSSWPHLDSRSATVLLEFMLVSKRCCTCQQSPPTPARAHIHYQTKVLCRTRMKKGRTSVRPILDSKSQTFALFSRATDTSCSEALISTMLALCIRALSNSASDTLLLTSRSKDLMARPCALMMSCNAVNVVLIASCHARTSATRKVATHARVCHA